MKSQWLRSSNGSEGRRETLFGIRSGRQESVPRVTSSGKLQRARNVAKRLTIVLGMSLNHEVIEKIRWLSSLANCGSEISTGDFRWDEKAGLRRDALSSQVIDALEAHETRRPAMRKPSTAALRRTGKLQDRQLTMGLDLGDRLTMSAAAQHSSSPGAGRLACYG